MFSNQPGDGEAARAELLDQCEEQFEQLKKLQKDVLSRKSAFSAEPNQQSKNRLMATKAQLAQCQTMEPRLLSTNPEMLLHAGKEEMLKLCSELEMIAACCKATKDRVTDRLQREQKWLENANTLFIGAKDVLQQLISNEYRLLQELRNKIHTMKDYKTCLEETLSNIVEDCFPPLTHQENGFYNNGTPNPQDNRLSMLDIIEMLMNKTLGSPHDPYLTMDESFWTPYVEVLLRHKVARRHPEQPAKIRLEYFY